MEFYSVSENGALRKAKKILFSAEKIYIIDGEKLVYLWIGNKASVRKRNFGIDKAKNLSSKPNKKKLEILEQGKEYGSFLLLMKELKLTNGMGFNLDERPELEIQYEDTMELLNLGFDPDLEAEITLKVQEIKKENLPYEQLCQRLVLMREKVVKSKPKLTKKEIENKKKEIINSTSTYDEVCWLIAQLMILLEKGDLK
jgi:hypothetical protein